MYAVKADAAAMLYGEGQFLSENLSLAIHGKEGFEPPVKADLAHLKVGLGFKKIEKPLLAFFCPQVRQQARTPQKRSAPGGPGGIGIADYRVGCGMMAVEVDEHGFRLS